MSDFICCDYSSVSVSNSVLFPQNALVRKESEDPADHL